MCNEISTKMKKQTGDNVYKLYKPIYILSNILTLTSSSAWKTKPGEMESKDRCYGFTLITFGLMLCVLTYFAVLDAGSMHPIGGSVILINMDRASLVLKLLLLLIVLKTSWDYRYDLPKYMKNLSDFDESARVYFNEKIDTKQGCKRHINNYLWHMLISNAFMVGELIYQAYVSNSIQWYNVSNLLGFLIREVMVFQFITMLNFSYWRFAQVNNFINGLDPYKTKEYQPQKNSKLLLVTLSHDVDGKKSSHWDKMRIDKLKDNMTMLRIMHECLIGVCQKMSDSYGLFQAASIIITLLEQLTESFGIFMAISHDDEITDVFLYSTVLRAVFYMYVTTITHHYFVFYFCDIVAKESIKSGQLIQNVFLKTEYREHLIEDIRLFSLQLKQNEVYFSAAGVFVLDWEMMSDVVSEVSSYLIFFVQSSGFSFNHPSVAGKEHVPFKAP